jgi:hypothetical protein
MATRTGERTSRRHVKEVPQRSPEFEHLDLVRLREYRKALTTEETRVSYWRRLVQARLDLFGLGVGTDDVRLDQLRMALSETRVGLGRMAYVEVNLGDTDAPMPDLDALWSRDVSTDNPEEVAQLRDDLTAAEGQLSAFRTALHDRLDRATSELIARYRENPRLALTALPLPPDELAS